MSQKVPGAGGSAEGECGDWGKLEMAWLALCTESGETSWRRKDFGRSLEDGESRLCSFSLTAQQMTTLVRASDTTSVLPHSVWIMVWLASLLRVSKS